MFTKGVEIIFSVIVVVCGIIKASKGADLTDISRLRAAILTNYDRFARPVESHHNTTSVWIYFYSQGFEFDEHRGMLTLHLRSAMFWKDMHMTWDPVAFGNITVLPFSKSELWHPDLTVLNNYDNSEVDHFGNIPMLVYHTAGVWWVTLAKFQVGCLTNLRLWPYDRQSCSVHLSSWIYSGFEVNFTVPQGRSTLTTDRGYVTHLENREWKLVNSSVYTLWEVFYCCPEYGWTTLVITVDIERRSSSHSAAVTVVGLGIASAILISFWLDPFAHERIPLTLLIILINSLYLQYMHQVIPANGATAPLIICFFRDSLIMVTTALAWTVGARYIAKTKRNSPVPLPNFVQTLLNSFIGAFLCLNPRPGSKGESQRESGNNDAGDVSELVEDNTKVQEDWEWMALLLDRIAFFLYLITYAIFILAFL